MLTKKPYERAITKLIVSGTTFSKGISQLQSFDHSNAVRALPRGPRQWDPRSARRNC